MQHMPSIPDYFPVQNPPPYVEAQRVIGQQAQPDAGAVQARKVRNLTDLINQNARPSEVLSHREWEKGLWFANCWVIPLVVYPILSLFGHLVIAITRDRKSDAYRDIRAYLNEQSRMIPDNDKIEGKIRLSETNLNVIRKILRDESIDTDRDALARELDDARVRGSNYEFYY